MDIGSIDLVWAEVPRRRYQPRLILAAIAQCWPQSVFESLEDEATRSVWDALHRSEKRSDDEFFVYRNAASADDWTRHGATTNNANDMVHFLVRPTHAGNSLEITMVVGEITPEMGRLYWMIDKALTTTGKPAA